MKKNLLFTLTALLAALFVMTGCEGDAALSNYAPVHNYIDTPSTDLPDVDFPEEEIEEDEDVIEEDIIVDEDTTDETTVYCQFEYADVVECLSSATTPSLTAETCAMATGTVVTSCD